MCLLQQQKIYNWQQLSVFVGASPQVLHAVSVPLITNAQCNSDYGGSITGSMVCAGKRGVGGVDACQVYIRVEWMTLNLNPVFSPLY